MGQSVSCSLCQVDCMLNNAYGHSTVEKTIKLIESLFYVNVRCYNDNPSK